VVEQQEQVRGGGRETGPWWRRRSFVVEDEK